MEYTSTEIVSAVDGHLADRLSHRQEAAKKAVERDLHGRSYD